MDIGQFEKEIIIEPIEEPRLLPIEEDEPIKEIIPA